MHHILRICGIVLCLLAVSISSQVVPSRLKGGSNGRRVHVDEPQTTPAPVVPEPEEKPVPIDVEARKAAGKASSSERQASASRAADQARGVPSNPQELRIIKSDQATNDKLQAENGFDLAKSPGRLNTEDRALTQQGAPVLVYFGENYVILFGVYHPIINGQISVEGRLYVVCKYTVAMAEEFICCVDQVYEKAVGAIQCCGSLFYFPATELCCNGEFYSQLDELTGLPTVCCGEVYNIPSQEICCAGLPYTNDVGCCAVEPYLRNTHCCSSGQVYPINPAVFPFCSSSSGVCTDTATHVCCGQTLYLRDNNFQCCGTSYVQIGQCCGVTVIDPSQSGCCANQISYLRNTHCCYSAQVYPINPNAFPFCSAQSGVCTDTATQVCCGQTLYQRDNNFQCCGTSYVQIGQCCGVTVFDPSQSGCCANLTPYLRNTHCCYSDQVYPINPSVFPFCSAQSGVCTDTATHVCCGQTLYLRDNNFQCCGTSYVQIGQCCGASVIDPSQSGCCANQIPYSRNIQCCVSDQVYPINPNVFPFCSPPSGVCADTATQVCCGQILYLRDNNFQCCGTSYVQIGQCCGASIMDPSQSGCCANLTPYLRNTHCCYSDQVYPINPNVFPFCSAQSGVCTDTATQVCCGQTLYQRDNNFQCCGTSYVQIGQCCGVTVFDPSQSGCCANLTPYSRNTHCCYSDQVYPINPNVFPFCSAQSGVCTDTATQVCCGQTVYLRDNNFQCCGTSYVQIGQCCGASVIDPSQSGCCANQIPYSRNIQCCVSDQVYPINPNAFPFCSPPSGVCTDTATEVCCGQTLYLRDNNFQCCGTSYVQIGQCCGASIMDPSQSGCCANLTPYLRNTHCCYSDQVYPINPNVFPFCSAQSGVCTDTATQVCCGQTLYQRDNNFQCCGTSYVQIGQCCGVTVFDPSQSGCCANLTPYLRNTHCCYSDQVYPINPNVFPFCSAQSGVCTDTATHVCCGQILYLRDNYYQCCGTSYVKLGQCCGASVIDSSQSGCCANLTPYLRNTHCCYSDQVYPINPSVFPFCSAQSGVCTDTATQVCCGQTLHTRNNNLQCCGTAYVQIGQCCGTTVIDPSQSGCCANQIPYSRNIQCCVSDQVYPINPNAFPFCSPPSGVCTDTATQVCCGQTLYARNNNFQCCGTSYVQIGQCCGASVFDPSQSGCCANQIPYLRNSQCCVSDQVYPINPNAFPFCSPPSGVCTDTATQVCCGQTLYARNNNFQCCGTSYVQIGQCCGASVIDPSQIGCCANQIPYSRNIQCCVSDQVYPINPNAFPFCSPPSGVCTDTATQVCCAQTLHARNNNFQCCGTSYVQIGQCCGASVIDPSQSGCCANQTPYLRNTQCCVSGQVHLINPGVFPFCSPPSGACTETLTQGCCGQTPYQKGTQQCCQDSTIKGLYEPCTTDACSRSDVTCCLGTPYLSDVNYICCGTQYVLSIQTGCCANLPYQKNSQKCCQGSTIRTLYESCSPGVCGSPGVTCCLGTAYQTDFNYICCGTQYVLSIQTGCCANIPYEKNSQQCCQDSTIKATFESCSPGGCSQPGVICCQGVPHPIQNGYVCCGVSYVQSGQCCGVTPQTFNTGCCAGVSFPRFSHKCCYNSLIVPFNQQCGSNTGCNDPGFTCCQENRHAVKSNYICCGAKYVHTSMCCAGQYISPLTTGCCGNVPYAFSSQQCCFNGQLQASNSYCSSFPGQYSLFRSISSDGTSGHEDV